MVIPTNITTGYKQTSICTATQTSAKPSTGQPTPPYQTSASFFSKTNMSEQELKQKLAKQAADKADRDFYLKVSGKIAADPSSAPNPTALRYPQDWQK